MMRPTNSRTACSYLDQFPDSIDQCDYVFHCLGARRDRDAADAHSLAAGRQHSLLPDGTPSVPMRDPVPPDTRPGGLTSTVRGRPRQMPPRAGGRGTERFGSQVQRGHGGSHPRGQRGASPVPTALAGTAETRSRKSAWSSRSPVRSRIRASQAPTPSPPSPPPPPGP